MSQGSPTLRIRIVTEQRVPAVFDAHRSNLSPYLFPRSIEEFEAIAMDEALFELVDTTASESAPPVGMCYVRPSAEDEHEFEFGGVYLVESLRGRRLLDKLGRVAIATQFVATAPRSKDRLIAHVHVDNKLPRSLLERLGFVDTRAPICLPRDRIPPNMKRDDNGDVWGDTFEFDFATLASSADSIAQMLDAADRTIEVEVAAFAPDHRAASLEALRAIASGYRASC